MTKPDNGLKITGPVSPLAPLATGLEPGGRLERPLRAILFDVYGTLFISASGDISTARSQPAVNRQVADLLAETGREETPTELYQQFREAIAAAHARRKEEGIDYPEVEIDRIWAKVLKLDDLAEARKFALDFEMAVNPVYPMPHAAELLRQIRSIGLPAGIISNAQFYTPLIFEYFLDGLPEETWAAPDLVFYSYRHGYGKPSRYMFEKAVAALKDRQINPDQVLYLGNDQRNDIRPARACGFQTALFAGDARSLRLRETDQQDAGIQPNLIITDLAQLAPHLPRSG
ncbi:MAG: HAD family hydrolase [Desulfosudaceae bacterium]